MGSVCVLMPAYNPGEIIFDSIDSIYAGTFKDFDFVIVDDGSSFSVKDYVGDKYPRMEVIRAPSNLGIAGALNYGMRGIAEKQYDYVLRMDVGDVASPDRLDVQVRAMDSEPDVVICGTWIEVVDEVTRKVAYRLEWPESDQEIRRMLPITSCVTHASMIIRVADLMNAGGYSEKYPTCEDYELLRRMSRVGKIVNVPKFLMQCEDGRSGLSVRRRREQLVSRLRVQFRYKNDKRSIKGMARTALLLAVPEWLLNFRRRLSSR